MCVYVCLRLYMCLCLYVYVCVYICMCICMFVCVYAHVCVLTDHATYVEVRGQLTGLSLLLPSYGAWGLSSSPQAWQQATLSTEPLHQPVLLLSLRKKMKIGVFLHHFQPLS